VRLLAKKTALTVILVLTTSALGCSRDGSSLGSVAAAGSDAREAPDATSTDPGAPPFNYIPLNDKACVIEEAEEAVVRQAVERIEEISATYTNEIGGGFELCSEENKNGCPACDVADNKMLAILRTLDGFVNIRGGSAEAYFREALRYPYRHLSVSTGACADLEPGSCPAGSETNIVLTQSRSQPCADGAAPCDHYSIESESLDGSCLQFPMSFYGADEGGTLVANLHEQTAEDVAFGFIVPFVRTLPEKPDRISEAELIEFLNVVAATKDRVDVRVWNPTLTISGEAGARCGVLRGWVDKQTFVDAAAAMDLSGSVLDAVEAVLSSTEEPVPGSDDRKGIPGMLSFKLEPGTFVSGLSCQPNPCTELPEPTCAGGVLEGKGPIGNCTYPRPADFEPGDSIESVCDFSSIRDWSVDCEAIGGTCSEGACSTTWRAPTEGEVVITELMLNPGFTDPIGEWFELHNSTAEALNLGGCKVTSWNNGPEESFVISSAGPLVLTPGSYLVVAATSTPEHYPGFEPGYVYHQTIVLEHKFADTLTLTCGDTVIDELSWDPTSDFPFEKDVSTQLDTGAIDATQNDDTASWCLSTNELSAKVKGTPGTANGACP